MRTTWTQSIAWLAAVTVASLLAFAHPSESALMGRLPALNARRLNQQPITLPYGLPAGRTLTLVAFRAEQRPELESWIKGMGLRDSDAIAWLKMPVLNDPGSESARTDIESRIRARHSTEADGIHLVPVFTNRDQFIRAAGMSGTDHAWVLVIDRDGQVLARVEGEFTEAKGQALRATLSAQNF